MVTAVYSPGNIDDVLFVPHVQIFLRNTPVLLFSTWLGWLSNMSLFWLRMTSRMMELPMGNTGRLGVISMDNSHSITTVYHNDLWIPPRHFTRWRHQMETFSAFLAFCKGNSPVTGEFPTQRPVTRSFDVFFDLHLDKRLSEQSWGWWCETPSRPLWRHCNEMEPRETETASPHAWRALAMSGYQDTGPLDSLRQRRIGIGIPIMTLRRLSDGLSFITRIPIPAQDGVVLVDRGPGPSPWWRHQMETFSALLALCAGIHRSPVKSPHKGRWRGALMFSLICA